LSESRPTVMGTRGAITSSNYMATSAGYEILLAGGSAIDASIAAGLALHVVEPHMNGIGGETPILLYSARKRRFFAMSGQGPAPKAATLQFFQRNGIKLIPGDGLLPATVPASFDAWVTCLRFFGTMTLGEVIAPAIRLAEEGFPVYPTLRQNVMRHAKRFLSEWPTTARIYLPRGRVPRIGEVLRQNELAKTLRSLTEAERRAGKDRERGLEAAGRYFYEGPIARKIAKFAAKRSFKDATGKYHNGLITVEDLADYKTRLEKTVNIVYKGLTVHKCGPWTQGPVLLQQLRLLEDYDLRRLRHNSADYIHLITEASKLAFADREAFYGDPLYTDVPLTRLLSRDYSRKRKELIDMRKASLALRPGSGSNIPVAESTSFYGGDTTHVDAVDSDGNMVSATPSGGWIWSSPVIEGLGFPLGTRGQIFSLDPAHPNCVAPGKRPRTTLTPSLISSKRRPVLAFGTPGGDQQDQWALQFFLNFVEFGMGLQGAIDAPSFHNQHFPSSFYPRKAEPGSLYVEGRIPKAVVNELRNRGHNVIVEGDWVNGRMTAVHYDWENHVVSAAASSRYQTAYALAH
jgi:gamma-glutamyltranspeptidase/glutathione hydrolase